MGSVDQTARSPWWVVVSRGEGGYIGAYGMAVGRAGSGGRLPGAEVREQVARVGSRSRLQQRRRSSDPLARPGEDV